MCGQERNTGRIEGLPKLEILRTEFGFNLRDVTNNCVLDRWIIDTGFVLEDIVEDLRALGLRGMVV